MITKYFGDKLRKAKSSERAEAMPAAIITAIVSSLLLLGIASTVALVVESKSESESNVQLTTAVSNIDVSLRSDVTNASYIAATAKVKQPTGRLLTPTDVVVTGTKMHIPATDGGCKVVRWVADGNTVSRQLTIHALSSNVSGTVTCDETSEKLAERKKTFAQDVNISAPFTFHNQVGRSIVFNHANASMDTVNAQLDAKLKALNVQKLSDADFNALTIPLLKGDSFVAGFADPTACPMSAPRGSNGVCPDPEADTIVAAWDSLKIAKVSVDFTMGSASGESVQRDIEQNSSVPLYRNAAEAEAAVAGVARGNKPAAPVLSMSTDRVVLGQNYTINWTSTNLNKCPANTEQTFNLYENNKLVKTTTDIAFTKAHTVSTDEYVEYRVQVECARGALLVTSDMSNSVSAKVLPASPTLNITKQPATAANVALNAELGAAGQCLYGTTVGYIVTQTENSYAAAGKSVTFPRLGTAMTVPINGNGSFPVVEGARYKYRVDANCSNGFGDVSPNTARETNAFTTLIQAPTPTTVFTAPGNESAGVATNATLTWSRATCGVGASPQYLVQKNVNNGGYIGAQTLVNWANQNSVASNNGQGSYVGYTINTRCAGTAVNSAESPQSQVRYATYVAAPAPLVAHNDGGTWVGVNDPIVCAPGIEGQYRRVQTMQDGRGSAIYGGWNTQRSEPLPGASNGGYPQGAFVEGRCVGPNAASNTTGGANTTKWVRPFNVSFSAGMGWRRLNVNASCPQYTRLNNFYLYVAANGWGGARTSYTTVTDEGTPIYDSFAGPGGNSGWVQMNATQNTQWIGTTAHWGVGGTRGWGSRVDGTNMTGTYWNATGWGNFAYWWYGSCSTDYMTSGAKGSYWQGGEIRNAGDPGARYNAAGNSISLTTAGQNAIR